MSTSAQSELSEQLDNVLLDVLKNGQVVVDEAGNPVKITPTAAILKVVLERLKHLGISQELKPGSKQAALINELKLRNPNLRFTPLPPIGEGEDKATG